MSNVFHINSRRTFSEEDARSLLPVIRRITEQAARSSSEIQEQLRWVPREEALYRRLTRQLESIVRTWASKISRLGCGPRGIWLVDFDAGNGWFSWRYGDDDLNFFTSNQVSRGADSAAFEELLS